MNLIRAAVVIAVMFLVAPCIAQERPKSYVGEVFIVGNTATPDRYIRAQLDLFPGKELHYPKLRVAEQNLAKMNWFLVDAKKKIRPTVTTLDSPGPFKDILIKVHERPGNWARLAAWEIVLAGTTMNPLHLRDAIHVIHGGLIDWQIVGDGQAPSPPAAAEVYPPQKKR